MSRSEQYSSRHAAPTPLAGWAVLVSELGRRPRPSGRFHMLRHRPLWVCLAALVLLSARLDNSVRADEALTLYTGAWIRRSWSTGEDVYSKPDTFFAGLPSLYPPVVSAIESVTGLIGARTVSLVLMAIATVAVFAIADALFDSGTGWRPGSLAAALFATSGPVLVHAHLAIPQTASMAVLLVGFAFSLRVMDAGTGSVRSVLLTLAAGVVLGFAAVLSYATILALPFVVAVLLARVSGAGATPDRQALRMALVVGLIQPPVAGLTLAGTSWLIGLRVTLLRLASSIDLSDALVHTVAWSAVPLGLAFLAPATVAGSAQRVVQALAAGAAVLALRQLLVGGDPTAYLGLALALAAPLGGFLLAKLAKVRWGWVALVAVGYAALTSGMAQSQAVVKSWPDSTPLVRQVSYAVDAMPWIRMLGESPEAVRFGLWGRLEPWQVEATYPGSFRYHGLTDLEAIRAAMADNYVQLVFFDGSTEAGRTIDPADYGFRLTDTVPQAGSTGVWRIYQRFDAVPAP